MEQALKIYLAARYERRAELSEYAERLRSWGYVITSSWLKESDAATFEAITDDVRAEIARRDLADIRDCDLFIRFSETPRSVRTTGGSLVEMGYALALPRTVLVVGPKENVFHYLDDVYQFDTFGDVLNYLIEHYPLKVAAAT